MHDAIQGQAQRPFVIRLVGFIVSGTFDALGVTFAILGATSDEDAFLPLGIALLVTGGIVLTTCLLVSRSAAAGVEAAAAARTQRATVRVLAVDKDLNSRVGVRHPVKLRLEMPSTTEPVEVKLWATPPVTLTEGDLLQVAYDPDEPRNVLPV